METTSWNTFSAQLAKIMAVDANASASKQFYPDGLNCVLVGDLVKIERPIRALQFGEVVILDGWKDGHQVVR